MFFFLVIVDQFQWLKTILDAIYASSNTYIASATFLLGAFAADEEDEEVHEHTPSPSSGADASITASNRQQQATDVDHPSLNDDNGNANDETEKDVMSIETVYLKKVILIDRMLQKQIKFQRFYALTLMMLISILLPLLWH